jgi:hypothetical protein
MQRALNIVGHIVGLVGALFCIMAISAGLTYVQPKTEAVAGECLPAGGMVNPCATLDTAQVEDMRPALTTPAVDVDTDAEGQDVVTVDCEAVQDDAMNVAWVALQDLRPGWYDEQAGDGCGAINVPVGTVLQVPTYGTYVFAEDGVYFAPQSNDKDFSGLTA